MKQLARFVPASILFAFALGIRVLYNVTVARRYVPTHDAFFYQTIGFNALSVHCYCLHLYYPTVNRAPLWPALIALISIPFGASDFYARLFFSVLGAGTCVFVYLFAKALTNNIYIGLSWQGLSRLSTLAFLWLALYGVALHISPVRPLLYRV